MSPYIIMCINNAFLLRKIDNRYYLVARRKNEITDSIILLNISMGKILEAVDKGMSIQTISKTLGIEETKLDSYISELIEKGIIDR